jgi:glycine cleavage system pyridoxal-binding protein P
MKVLLLLKQWRYYLMFVKRPKERIMFVNSSFLKILPQTLSVLQTRSTPIGIELVVVETTKNLIFKDFLDICNIQENMVKYMIMLLKANDNEIK